MGIVLNKKLKPEGIEVTRLSGKVVGYIKPYNGHEKYIVELVGINAGWDYMAVSTIEAAEYLILAAVYESYHS